MKWEFMRLFFLLLHIFYFGSWQPSFLLFLSYRLICFPFLFFWGVLNEIENGTRTLFCQIIEWDDEEEEWGLLIFYAWMYELELEENWIFRGIFGAFVGCAVDCCRFGDLMSVLCKKLLVAFWKVSKNLELIDASTQLLD